MMRWLKIFVLASTGLWIAVANPPKNNTTLLTGSAGVISQGSWSIGLFRPLRYGILKGQELSTHPLAFFVIPNLTYKKVWRQKDGKTLATRHSFYYPTPLLRLLAKEGIGGIISPEFDFPPMISFYDELQYSTPLKGVGIVTSKIGLGIGITADELDERTTIDLPVVFPRLAVFYNGWNIKIGSSVAGKLIGRWDYFVDGSVFFVPGADENLAFEHKALILWNKSARFQLALGYKLTYTEFPFGTQWHMLPPKIPGTPLWVPLFDLKWTW